MLSHEDVIERIKKPVHQIQLKRAREDEQRHRMHVDGERAELERFLSINNALETPTTHQMRLRFSKALSKSVFSQVTNLFSKCFTQQGTTYLYRFRDERDEEDFRQFLSKPVNGQTVYQYLHTKLKKALHTGFQGLFHVDIAPMVPALQPNSPMLPEPFVQYISSQHIHDLELVGQAVTFAILKQTSRRSLVVQGIAQEREVTDYFIFEPDVTRVYSLVEGDYRHLSERDVENLLGYVPLFIVSDKTVQTDDDVQRTSHIEASMEVADMLLTDHSDHEMNKKLHAYQEKWTYGTECTACSGKGTVLIPKDGVMIPCQVCAGTGNIIPVGPDRVYMLNTPSRPEHPDLKPPAGYISKDLGPTKYLMEQIRIAEDKIPKSIFSREGIVSFNTKVETAHGKELDMQSVYDKLREFSENIERVVKSVVDTMAQLRYGDRFLSSQVNYSRHYGLRSVAQMEEEFRQQKAAEVEDNLLLQTLRELIVAKYRTNPDLQSREMIKLDLIPFPSLTINEVQGMPFVAESDKRMKVYFNAYVQRFEQENGDLLAFASLLPYREKIRRIQEIFNLYNLNPVPNEQNQIA